MRWKGLRNYIKEELSVGDMIITISGIAGSGKSSVAKKLAQKLTYAHYSVGDLMRAMAKERGVSLLELGKLAEKDKAIDLELDERQKALGKKDDFVIDSRLGFHFLKQSFKVFLQVELEVAADRILKEKRAHESYADLADSVASIKKRIASEDKRYSSYYKIDYQDKTHYDLVVDTTDLTVAQVVGKIVDAVEKR
jgi:cytidylate kinase|tara:strand:- start:319 stop:903 length:585 start_codon:yes stop_codon:yes gene_type:complete